MKDIQMQQVYIREEFAKMAKMTAVIEGKRLQEVIDEILSAYFNKTVGENNGK